MKVNTPHNNLCIKVLRIIAEARKFFKHFLKQEFVKQLDLRTLKLADKSFTDGSLKEYFSDLLYTCKWRGKKAYLHLLIEHKSSFDFPKLQILCYLSLAYRQQRLQHEAKNQERKSKKLPKIPFEYEFIFPIILYHGKDKFQDIAFANEFEHLDEYAIQFIPDVKIFIINIHEYSDEFIEELGKSFVLPMLLLFKHKADKEFVKQHYEKVFIFVEQKLNADQIREFIKAFTKYIYQTFKFDIDEMRNWLPVLPSPIQEEFMSTYDIVKQAGEIEGFQKGEQAGFQKGEQAGAVKGEHKGEQKGELKNKLETLVDLLVKAPKWKNKTLAEVTRLKKADVKQLKKALKKNKNSKFKVLVLELFQPIPYLKEKDIIEVNALATSLFAQYQAAKSKK